MLRFALRPHPIRPLPSLAAHTPSLTTPQHRLRLSSTTPSSQPTPPKSTPSTPNPSQPQSNPKPKKTMAELDAELMRKLEEMSGGGGEAGLELENGKPVAMKRGVRENMFRLI